MLSTKIASGARQFSSKAVILSATRTPIGSFRGSLASLSAPELGAIAVKSAVAKAGIKSADVNEVILGNVLGAGQGQAPARQAAVKAGLPFSTVCTTVNKVCASGTKTIMFGASSIMLGQQQVVVAGGFESMSNVPYYSPNVRAGVGYGHVQLQDGILRDGLWDAFDDHHMGNCAEKCAKQYGISRADQDAYSLESYRRAAATAKAGGFAAELTPVELVLKKGDKPTLITADEEVGKLKADKVPTLKPAFIKDGSVTAANSSKINDGAAALVLASADFAQSRQLKPIARILGFGDAEQAPIDFTTTPALAIPIALRNAGIDIKQVDLFEINEAFAAVAIANGKLLNIEPAKLNAFGGAVAMGHPIGCSGARIVATLIHGLKRTGGKIGVAAICNGGGGASAIVVEVL